MRRGDRLGLLGTRAVPATGLVAFVLMVVLSMMVPTARANAACSVPNQISNGQVADATAVMSNFNAVTDCVNSVVQPTGSPATGNLPVFSGPNSIGPGDLSGDCATSGSLAVTCTKTGGVPLGYFATGTDASQLSGTVSVGRFNNGLNADASHFLRGDGLWATPPTGGGGAGAAYEGFGDLQSLAGLTPLTGASANIALTDGMKAHKVGWTASGSNTLQIADKAQASGSFDWYMRATPLTALATNVQFGLVLRNSTSGKLVILALNSDTNLTVQEWSSPTTFSSALSSVAASARTPLWLRISSDGSTLTFYYSANGVDWETIGTRTISTFMGSIDRAGIGVDCQSAGAVRVSDFGTLAPS